MVRMTGGQTNVRAKIILAALAWYAFAADAVELKNGAEFSMADAPTELTAHIRRGGSVRFLLEENATTGYEWKATYASNECAVVVEHRAANRAQGLCGAPGKVAFTVTKNAAVQSPSLVEFVSCRSWEKGAPAKRVRLVLYTIPGEAVDFRYPASRTLSMLKAECRNRGIALVDWHVHIRGGLTPEMAAEREKACGIRQSAMENHGREWEIFDNARLVAFAENARKATVNGHTLPVGIQVNDRDWFRQIDPATRAKFDYILADTMIMGKLPNGRDKRLWLVKDLAELGDPEKWMDEYVDMNLQILGEPISILANPGYLPAPLDGLHDRLWTDERMRKVIGKAVSRGIAIEIQAESPYPSPRFLKLAKAMGAKFSFGTNNYDAAPKDLSRWLEAIVWLDLKADDIWTPQCLRHESPSLETATWQAAIDAASAAGGGVVTLPAGRHLTGTLFLRNNVTLELAEGCVLQGSANRADYPDIPIRYAELREPWQALVAACGVTNVAVVGAGEIFGDGRAFPHGARLGRPQGLLFLGCRDVRIEGIRLRDLARWTCYLKECDGVTVRKLTVDSHANANNDGIDIDSRNVLVEDCAFDSDDDGIVLKSDNADFIVENVTVRNCRVASTCSAIKLGTGSHGGFRNILIENIDAGTSSREWCDAEGRGVISRYRVETWPGSEWTPSLLSGIALECVDGGLLENVTVRQVRIARAASPIFIRGGLRRGRTWGDAKEPVDLKLPFGRSCRVKGVLIENVTARATSWTASSITGVPGLRVTDITLRNVDITVPGAGEKGRAELDKPVPECVAAYPESNMFDHRMLPAHGFYLRHADRVRFDRVTVKLLGSDVRPAIVREDVTAFTQIP